MYDVKTYYPAEYKTGLKALELMKDRIGIDLPKDEAASVALHIVNAEYGTEISQVMNLTTVIHEVIEVIEEYFKIVLEVDSLDFERFVTHLKFICLDCKKMRQVQQMRNSTK